MRHIVLALLVATAPGCGLHSLPDATAPATGCPAGDIHIVESHGAAGWGPRRWVAECYGHIYQCTESQSGAGICTEQRTAQSAGPGGVATPPPAAAAGPFDEAARSLVNGRRSTILACTSGAAAAIDASWDAAGNITIGVRGATPDVLGCVQSSFAGARIQADMPGHVLQAVSP